MTPSEPKPSLLHRTWRLYADGFRGLSRTGRILWVLIIAKLFVMFAIIKPFFFPNHSKQKAQEQGITPSEYVQQNLLERAVDTLTSAPIDTPYTCSEPHE